MMMNGTDNHELGTNQKLNSETQADAPSADLNKPSNGTESTENGTETNSEAQATTAIVTYVGNSIWKDQTGRKWKNNDERKMPIAEYNKRRDLKFMVNYGEMKVIMV